MKNIYLISIPSYMELCKIIWKYNTTLQEYKHLQ